MKTIRILLCAVALTTLAGCGSDDDTSTASATGTGSATAAPDAGENTLNVEMVDYGYKVDGEVGPGVVTLASTNTGKEIHMAGIGKLKAGKTVADVVAATKAPPPEGGAGEGEDPIGALLEKEIDAPGHILLPGQTQSLTVSNVLDAGEYVMLCFIPTEGEGMPHFAKGMVAGFTVAAEKSDAKEPEADAEITLGDDADPVGVTELKAGKQVLKVTATGSKGKDFLVATLQPGKTVDDVDKFFESEYEKEGGPSKGAATRIPATVHASTFEIHPGQSIWMTVELKAGEVVLNSTTNPADDAPDDAEGVDKYVTVKVT